MGSHRMVWVERILKNHQVHGRVTEKEKKKPTKNHPNKKVELENSTNPTWP